MVLNVDTNLTSRRGQFVYCRCSRDGSTPPASASSFCELLSFLCRCRLRLKKREQFKSQSRQIFFRHHGRMEANSLVKQEASAASLIDSNQARALIASPQRACACSFCRRLDKEVDLKRFVDKI